MSSKVYFADLKTSMEDNILDKFDRLITKAGIDELDVKGKYVAVKIHFGEWGNMAFLRHQYAKTLCEHIKKNGGKPFLTDSNTLYVGQRGNAIDHLESAAFNGYNQLSVGVPIIIADGLRGTDERLIPVEGGEYVKEAKIGAAIAEADVLISLSHCKGHMSAGYGGVLKNLGMGAGSKKGKMEMHSAGKPAIDENNCIGCGSCVRHCANEGVSIVDGKAIINEDKCLGCGYCLAYCPKDAIECKWDEAKPVLNKKIAEYAKATINNRPAFHIAMAIDIQKDCDCSPSRNTALVADVGMFAGFDPVAIDQACVEKINEQPLIPGCVIEEHKHDETRDVFTLVHPNTDWDAGLAHAVKLELGTRDYELIEVK